MKAQRKTRLHSETNEKRPSHCSPNETDDLTHHWPTKYSPGVLVGDWQTASALQREDDKWRQHRHCGRCTDLRGVVCTWKPDVILRRTVRDGGYLYDRPPVLVCRDREPAIDCRLLHRSQLKSLYDQHYNEHPATQPAHVDCPDLLPEGPTNFGLLDKMAVKWQEEIAGLVALRTGPSLYRESYQGQTKYNGAKDVHVGCKNDGKSNGPKVDKVMLHTGGLSTCCKHCRALATCVNTKVLSTSCWARQSAATDHCEDTETLLPCDRHSTALDHCKDCEGNRKNVTAICCAARRKTAGCGCGPDSAVQALESENTKFNAGNGLAGNTEWQCNETGTHVQKCEPRIELTDCKAPERELRCGNNDQQFDVCGANVPGCEFPRWNVPELEFQRREVPEREFPERNLHESEFRRRNLPDCDCPGIQTLPSMPTKVTEHGLVTGIDMRKPGCAGKAFPEIGSTGNYVHGPGLDQEIDPKLEQMGQRYVPPILKPSRFVTALNSRHDVYHSCLNLSVL